MEVIKTKIEGIVIIEPRIFKDARGYFYESFSQKELAEHLQISPTAIAVKIKKLESDGFIEREKQSGDSRFNKVSITDKGMDIVKRTECIFGGIDSKMIEGLSPDEIDNFIIITEKLRANLENLLKDGESAK